MEVNNFKALEELVKPYKFISFCNSEGITLIANNNNVTSKAKRLDQIKKRLESKALPDGIYVVKAKDAIKGQSADEIIYIKGKPGEAPPEPATRQVKKLSDGREPENNVLSYQEAVRLNAEIAKLNYDVQNLTAENERLEHDIAELEMMIAGLEAAQSEKLSEGAPNTITQLGEALKNILPSVTAIFDTHYNIKDRELKLKEANLRPQAPQSPPAAPMHQEAPEIPPDAFILDQNEQNIINYFEALKQSNPDLYNAAYDNMLKEMEGGNQ